MGLFRYMASDVGSEVEVRLECGSGGEDMLGSETWGS